MDLGDAISALITEGARSSRPPAARCTTAPGGPVRLPDGRGGRLDLMLSGTIGAGSTKRHLVVELLNLHLRDREAGKYDAEWERLFHEGMELASALRTSSALPGQ
ncbi:hypothetical protein OHT93_11100 [Streptomyces sp. NBC_00191]|uniref:hypothetical protein n=1 Tax=Streptomyces sp. NBC_00191 TaxID=2975674 RepID=UPI00324B02B7